MTLRGQLRRAGLLQRSATQMPRRTLVRARSPGGGSDSDSDGAGCGGVCAVEGPPAIQEEDEEGNAEGTADDCSDGDSSGGDEEAGEDEDEAGLVDGGVAAVPLGVNGDLACADVARSVSEEADGRLQAAAAQIEQQNVELEVLRTVRSEARGCVWWVLIHVPHGGSSHVRR